MAQGNGLQLVDSFAYGGFHAVRALWKAFGLEEAIEGAASRLGTDMPLGAALFAMVANRLLAPRSELYCYEQWLAEEVYFPEGDGIELHHLYRRWTSRSGSTRPSRRRSSGRWHASSTSTWT